MNIEYVDFTSFGFEDFKAFILPDVYEDLLVPGVLEEDGMICVGALEDGKPSAALVARMNSDSEVDIASIFVAEGLRMQGIGKNMIRECLAKSLELLSFDENIEGMGHNLLMCIDYVLPADEFDGFAQFLSSCGFTIHGDAQGVYELTESSVDGLRQYADDAAKNVKLLKDEFGDDAFEADLAENAGLELLPDYSMFYGAADSPAATAMLAHGYDGCYMLITQDYSSGNAPSAAPALAYAVLSKLAKNEKQFTLAVDESVNIPHDIWNSLAADNACTYKRANSYMPVVFE